MKILLIGNSGAIKKDKGGQTTKLRLYKKKMEDEGASVAFIDLERFLLKPFSILLRIKKAIKTCDRIVLISGERACRVLIPFINFNNRKTKKPFILPLVGIGVLHFSINKLSFEDKNKFICEHKYNLGRRVKRIEKELKKITYILAETETINKIYSDFYRLSNCRVLNNFRDNTGLCLQTHKEHGDSFKMIFLSRVTEEKGILDLLNCMRKIKENYFLDIFGEISLSKSQQNEFLSLLSDRVNYRGVLDNELVINTLKNYDLFVFPTRYIGEGTPGVIAESLISGTPVLSSDFAQVKNLLKNGYDSIFFKMFDIDDLQNKIVHCIQNKDSIRQMRSNVLKSGEHYLYSHERDKFLKYVCGINT